MTPLVRMLGMAAVAAACVSSAVARQAPDNGSGDKNPSALTIIMSASVMVSLEMLEKYCSTADPARAVAYHDKVQKTVRASDPAFVALVKSSEVYPEILKSGEAQFAGMERRLLLERCEAFLAQG